MWNFSFAYELIFNDFAMGFVYHCASKVWSSEPSLRAVAWVWRSVSLGICSGHCGGSLAAWTSSNHSYLLQETRCLFHKRNKRRSCGTWNFVGSAVGGTIPATIVTGGEMGANASRLSIELPYARPSTVRFEEARLDGMSGTLTDIWSECCWWNGGSWIDRLSARAISSSLFLVLFFP